MLIFILHFFSFPIYVMWYVFIVQKTFNLLNVPIGPKVFKTGSYICAVWCCCCFYRMISMNSFLDMMFVVTQNYICKTGDALTMLMVSPIPHAYIYGRSYPVCAAVRLVTLIRNF